MKLKSLIIEMENDRNIDADKAAIEKFELMGASLFLTNNEIKRETKEFLIPLINYSTNDQTIPKTLKLSYDEIEAIRERFCLNNDSNQKVEFKTIATNNNTTAEPIKKLIAKGLRKLRGIYIIKTSEVDPNTASKFTTNS